MEKIEPKTAAQINAEHGIIPIVIENPIGSTLRPDIAAGQRWAWKLGFDTAVMRIEHRAIEAKRNALKVYEIHRCIKPKDKQAMHWHNGYDAAIQDLIDYLQSLKAQG